MIRNYLGFPCGITGAELAACAREQAISLGAELIVTRGVVGLAADGRDKIVTPGRRHDVRARSVIIATGVSYNRLEVEGVNSLIGKVVRGPELAMSDYLVRQIERTPCITVRLDTRVVRAEGGERLEALDIADSASRRTERVAASALFVLIGAGAHTDWLGDRLQRDEHGYVKTGRHVNLGIGGQPEWDLDRALRRHHRGLVGARVSRGGVTYNRG